MQSRLVVDLRSMYFNEYWIIGSSISQNRVAGYWTSSIVCWWSPINPDWCLSNLEYSRCFHTFRLLACIESWNWALITNANKIYCSDVEIIRESSSQINCFVWLNIRNSLPVKYNLEIFIKTIVHVETIPSNCSSKTLCRWGCSPCYSKRSFCAFNNSHCHRLTWHVCKGY